MKTLRPKTQSAFNSIMRSLLMVHGYSSDYVERYNGNNAPCVLLVSPSGVRMKYIAKWVRIILYSHPEAAGYPVEWWAMAKRWQKHLLLMNQSDDITRAMMLDFLDWLAGPENLVRPELPWQIGGDKP